MQSTFLSRRSWSRSWFALVCLLAVFVVSGVQVAHWDPARSNQASVQTAQASDGLCPICFSVPVGHGAAPTAILPVRIESTIAVAPIAPLSEGTQPEFHLHIRPPPSIA
jgi:hypothetical protein